MNKPWRRVEVLGPSMLPTLHPGDRLLVLAWPRRLLRVGHLVVRGGIVKRIAALGDGTADLKGDNQAASTDYPATPLGDIAGRAVYRYYPSERAGWLWSK